MYQLISFKPHSILITTFILCKFNFLLKLFNIHSIIVAFGDITIVSSESISSQKWSNIIQDLSSKIHDYKSYDKIIETHPLNEGFILLADNPKKPSPTQTTTKPTRISKSPNISSTTRKTTTMVKIKNRTSAPVGHVGRRLLNEPSYDTDIDTSTLQTQIVDDSEFSNFMKVDNEELSEQLFNFDTTADGSGESTLTLKRCSISFTKKIFIFYL